MKNELSIKQCATKTRIVLFLRMSREKKTTRTKHTHNLCCDGACFSLFSLPLVAVFYANFRLNNIHAHTASFVFFFRFTALWITISNPFHHHFDSFASFFARFSLASCCRLLDDPYHGSIYRFVTYAKREAKKALKIFPIIFVYVGKQNTMCNDRIFLLIRVICALGSFKLKTPQSSEQNTGRARVQNQANETNNVVFHNVFGDMHERKAPRVEELGKKAQTVAWNEITSWKIQKQRRALELENSIFFSWRRGKSITSKLKLSEQTQCRRW